MDIGFRVNEHPPGGRQLSVNMIMPAMGGCQMILDLYLATLFEDSGRGEGFISPARYWKREHESYTLSLFSYI